MHKGFNFKLNNVEYRATVDQTCSYRMQIFKIINTLTNETIKRICVTNPTRLKIIRQFQESIA